MYLTPREKQVFALLLTGTKRKDIARKLDISESTVGFFTKKIYKKLGVNSKPELIVRFHELKDCEKENLL